MEMQIIKLLNEYEKEKTKQDVRFWDYYQNGFHYLEYGQTYSELLMISKKYEFIKWLVENDKIDIVKVYENLTNYEIEIRIRAVKELLENNEEDTIAYLKLLMLLSISDTPIEDLILYLK